MTLRQVRQVVDLLSVATKNPNRNLILRSLQPCGWMGSMGPFRSVEIPLDQPPRGANRQPRPGLSVLFHTISISSIPPIQPPLLSSAAVMTRPDQSRTWQPLDSARIVQQRWPEQWVDGRPNGLASWRFSAPVAWRISDLLPSHEDRPDDA